MTTGLPRVDVDCCSWPTALSAPRNLKEPVFWKHSALKKKFVNAGELPHNQASMRELVRIGVTWAWGRILSDASRIVAGDTPVDAHASSRGDGIDFLMMVAVQMSDERYVCCQARCTAHMQ